MLVERHLIAEVNEANIYLLVCEARGEACLVDAAAFLPTLADSIRARGIHLASILITHAHYDHTSGLDAWSSAFPKAEIRSGLSAIGGSPYRTLFDGDTFTIGHITGRAITMQGHTSDSIAYHFLAPHIDNSVAIPSSVLFSGDALFAGSIGGTPTPEEQAREIAAIREKILALPPHTIIYPGHGPATTVSIEQQANPFLQPSLRR